MYAPSFLYHEPKLELSGMRLDVSVVTAAGLTWAASMGAPDGPTGVGDGVMIHRVAAGGIEKAWALLRWD